MSSTLSTPQLVVSVARPPFGLEPVGIMVGTLVWGLTLRSLPTLELAFECFATVGVAGLAPWPEDFFTILMIQNARPLDRVVISINEPRAVASQYSDEI